MKRQGTNGQKTFIALVEVKPRPDVKNFCWPFAGAFVRCYVTEATAVQAKRRISDSLHGDGLDLIEMQFCEPSDGEWEQEDDGTDEEGVKEAQRSGDVVYGSFFAYPA